ncbi:hypothetical protein BZL30_6571 [Mycobacterium kansasii]|uniref:Uncharacterized protein n=1 Tax=Mycobacterium kansasii TaxID=1768 RepID=A0A1V3WTK0_MYCKA|nr:hypothetical protein MKSMC1_56610 [Mycobacterium kansasii]OOK70250.1 hypothetical protein BZL30_6571 [Mycobacterium kansasii]OOK74465.1 hypothetical protein BZL29_4555 [Mycobacterium kansasii]
MMIPRRQRRQLGLAIHSATLSQVNIAELLNARAASFSVKSSS